MNKLTARDVDVLTSLRFGIVDEIDLIDELFNETQMSDANEEFQDVVEKQVNRANQEVELKNKKLLEVSLQLIEGHFPSKLLRVDLLNVAKLHGKHHGRNLIKIIRSIEYIDRASVTNNYNKLFESDEKNRAYKRRRMLCRRVMKRLESGKLIRIVDKPDRFMPSRYYHLTKKFGKPWLEEYLGSKGLDSTVVAHNYQPMHAKHDAMVSEVNKVIIKLANSQSYSIVSLASEAQMKSIVFSVHRDRELKYNTKFANKQKYADVLFQASVRITQQFFCKFS